MQDVSQTYTSILANGGWHECKLEINGVAYGMEQLVSMQTTSALWDAAVSVGNAIAGTIDVQLIAQSQNVPTMAKLCPYVRAVNNTQQSEWIPKGVYWIDTREYDKETGILTLVGMDAMLKGEQAYMSEGDQGVWPQVDINVLCDIANRLELGSDKYTKITNPTGNPKAKGWYYYSATDKKYYLSTATSVNPATTYYKRSNTGIDSRTLPLINKYYAVQYTGFGDEAYTVREVLGYIGAMYAGNWIINEVGQLRLVVLGDIPAETNYMITENEARITLGGDRIILL